MTRDELIARLEAATGPDRELDRAIAMSLGWRHDPHDGPYGTWTAPDGTRHTTFNEWTASIDAALTLVPEGMDWLICSRRRNFRDGYYVHIMDGDVNRDGHSAGEAWHLAPAVALCIAALKARATP